MTASRMSNPSRAVAGAATLRAFAYPEYLPRGVPAPGLRGAPMPVAADGSPAAGGIAADPAEGKLAARVARRIEADVVARGWPVGTSLGSEPELRARHGVSRAVLREAVRLVEHHQVARMRRGPGGGLFVVSPDAGPAARALVIYLQYAGTGVDALMAARRLLEPLSARLAAERIGEDGVALIRRTLAGGGPETPPARPPERRHRG